MNLQRVLLGIKAMGTTDLPLQGIDTRTHELDDAPTLSAHQMVMTLTGVDMLVQVSTSPQTILLDEAKFRQQVEIAIEGCPRDLEAPLLNRVQERLGVDMTMLRIYLAKEMQSLGCHSMPFFAQLGKKLV